MCPLAIRRPWKAVVPQRLLTRRQQTTDDGRRTRGAFTLVEILLALALVIVLMAAVYESFNWYRHIASGRFAETERAQIARAVFNRLQTDVRSIVFTVPDEKVQQGEAAGDQAAETVLVEDIDAADALAGSARGVVGDAEAIVLHVSKPPRGMVYSSFLEGGTRSSDLVSVSYFLADQNATGVRGEAARRFAAAATENGAAERSVQGLARLQGDRLAMDLADERADDAALAENTVLLSEEINYFRFRYFDGVDWWDAWDSQTYQALPRAVEVTIGFRPNTAAGESGEETVGLRRFVLAVPQSEPLVEE